MSTNPPAIMGEIQAGQSATVRNQLEQLISNLNKSTFDIAELLHTVKKNQFYVAWGFNTLQEYIDTLEIKSRKAQYLVRIVDVMDQAGVPREKYEKLGVAKLREVTSLDPQATYTNPNTKDQTPMKEFIQGFVEKGDELNLDEVKQHVKTLKGLTGENELVWANFCVKRLVLENVIKLALQKAKMVIGSVGKDDDGVSKDASDGAALEAIAVEYLNTPIDQNEVTKNASDSEPESEQEEV